MQQQTRHADPLGHLGHSPSPRRFPSVGARSRHGQSVSPSDRQRSKEGIAFLEPGSTPRERSRTRPAVGGTTVTSAAPGANVRVISRMQEAPSPSPISHGLSYRSVDHSTALFPSSSSWRGSGGDGVTGVVSALARVRKSSGRGTAGRHPRVVSPRSTARSVAPASASITTASPLASAQPSLRLSAHSPVVVALRAQWALLQQRLSLSETGWDGGAVPSFQKTAAMEMDVLRTLSALPASGSAAVVQDAAALAPYLLAFSAAPVPTARTQSVSLAALQGLLAALPLQSGRVAAAAFVRDLFLGEHQGLEALGIALQRSIAERDTDAHDLAAHMRGCRAGLRGHRDRGDESSEYHATLPKQIPAMSLPQHESHGVRRAAERTASIDSLIDLFFRAVVLSPTVASVLLGNAPLVHALVHYLPEATAEQSATIAALVHVLLRGNDRNADDDVHLKREGLSRAEAAAVLAGHQAHHVVQTCLRRSLRATYSGRADVAAGANVTTLCVLLRVATQLVSAPGAYSTLIEDDDFSVVIAQLLTVPWGDVVELACVWVVRLLSCHPLHGGPTLTANLMAKTEVRQVLTRLFGWREPNSFSFATSAALCWRWLLLASGTTHAAAEVSIAQPDILMSVVHAILTNPLPISAGMNPPRENAVTTGHHEVWTNSIAASAVTMASRLHRERALFTVELVIGIAASFAAGSPYTRAAAHLLILERLDASLLQALRSAADGVLQTVSDDYFRSFPPVVLEEGSELARAVVGHQRAERGRVNRGRLRNGHSSGDGNNDDHGCHSNPSSSTTFIGNARGSTTIGSSSASATMSRGSSVSSTGTPRRYRSQLMNTRSGLATSESGASRTHSGSGRGCRSTDPDKSGVGAPSTADVVVSSARDWRAVVQASWDILLSGEPTHGALSVSANVGDQGVSLFASPAHRTPGARSLTPVIDDRATGPRAAGFLTVSPPRASRSRRATSPTVVSSKLQQQRKKSITQLHIATAFSSLHQQSSFSPPLPHERCLVVQRAGQLADGGGLYRATMEVVLRLAHQYAGAGVVGQSQLPLSTLAEGELEAERVLTRAHERLPFSGSLHDNSEKVSCAFSAMTTTDGGGGQLQPLPHRSPNPWAPPPKARPARRWHAQDLEREEVLIFAIAYETLVRDLEETVSAVEAHIDWLRGRLRTCPMKARTRRVVLNDLYMNVYPKLHLFLQYIQHQVARSRAVLQILAVQENDDGGGICIHSGNIIDVYAAVGACVGQVVED